MARQLFDPSEVYVSNADVEREVGRAGPRCRMREVTFTIPLRGRVARHAIIQCPEQFADWIEASQRTHDPEAELFYNIAMRLAIETIVR